MGFFRIITVRIIVRWIVVIDLTLRKRSYDISNYRAYKGRTDNAKHRKSKRGCSNCNGYSSSCQCTKNSACNYRIVAKIR